MQYSSIVYLILIAGLCIWVMLLRRRESQLTAAIERNERARRTVFAFLNRLGDRMTTENLALEPALEIITEFVVDVTEAEAGAAYLLDPADKSLSAIVVEGLFPPMVSSSGHAVTKQKHLAERIKRERIPLGQGVIGEAAATGRPILISDAANDPRVRKPEEDSFSVRSILVAPLKIHGQILGVLVVVNRRGVGIFTEEELNLVVSLADQAASTVELVKLYGEFTEKQRIEQELKVAHDFQRMLLPMEFPAVPGFDLAAFSAPALEVGGDYYDFFWVDDQRRYLGVAIADVSGKGIPAALIMSMVRCTMRAVAMNNLSPRDVLVKANDRVYADTKENVFVTVTYGILDTHDRKFRFCRAGHEPVVTAKEATESVRLSSPDGIAIGMIDSEMLNEMLEEEVLQLEDGDTAILYTDGVIEAMDDAQQEYGQRRFFDFVAVHRREKPQQIIENALSDIRDFTRGHPQHDDITLVAIQVTGRNEQSQLTATRASSASA